MALQSSGAISLDDIHVEAGGTTGTQCAINNPDIRGLIDKADGAACSFSEFYGASAFTATHTLTQATYTSPSNLEYNGMFLDGSISPTTVGGFTFKYVYKVWDTTTAETTSDFWLYLNGTPAVDAISEVQIKCTDGTIISLAQSDATSSQSGSLYRFWVWTEADFSTDEHAQFVATFDGAGDIELSIT